MIVAGVMSGTSADGIDVAITRIYGRDTSLRYDLLHHSHTPYSSAVRRFILTHMNSARASVADLSRLNFLLGDLYADAVRAAQKESRIRSLDLVGCHGQTIYHQGKSSSFLGKKIKCTWQTGEGALLAARLLEANGAERQRAVADGDARAAASWLATAYASSGVTR